MSDKKKGRDPRTAISQKVMAELDRRTIAALQESHKAFAQENRGIDREQLLEYVRQCAEDIGHSPCSGEVIGGPYIAKRLGVGWGGVLQEAHLPPVPDPPLPRKKWRVYKLEYRRQTKLYRQEKAQRKKKKNEPPKGGVE